MVSQLNIKHRVSGCTDVYQCAVCGYRLSKKRKNVNYCSKCGQRLRWPEEQEEVPGQISFEFTAEDIYYGEQQ